MSRRSHGLVALLATALLLAVVVWWAQPASTPGPLPPVPTPGTITTLTPVPTSAPPSTPSSTPASTSPTDQATAPATVVPGATLTQCPRSGEAKRVTVVTFNIHSGLGGGGLHLEQIAGEIAAVDPDVVLLQEVDRFRPHTDLVDEPAYLAALLGMEQVYAANVVRPAATASQIDGQIGGQTGSQPGSQPDEEYGTAVLARLPVAGWTHTLLPNLPGRQQRGVQQVHLSVDGRPFTVYNAHLDHTTPLLRQEQMRKVVALVGTDPDPVILGGDFNATPGSPALATALAALHDTWPAVGVGRGPTVPVHVPRRRVDYLLTDDSWRPISAATWESAVSDHRGLVARFALLAPRVCG